MVKSLCPVRRTFLQTHDRVSKTTAAKIDRWFAAKDSRTIVAFKSELLTWQFLLDLFQTLTAPRLS